jgi:BRCT domain type II-containing protein
MAPKKAATASSLYVVVLNNAVESIYASVEAANAHLDSIKGEASKSNPARVEAHELKGGSITVDATKKVKDEDEDEPPKPKAKATQKTKAEKESSADPPKAKGKAAKKATGDDDEEPDTASTAKKTKTLTENPKAKAIEASLPEDVQALLAGSGTALAGLAIVVTGVPPTLGRQNAERLVINYGGKLAKSLSRNTSYVVVGPGAGPKKMEQIADLGTETLDEDGLIELIGTREGAGAKRGADEEEKPAVKRAKK